MTSEADRVKGKARALIARAAALSSQESSHGPRLAAGAMAAAVATAFRARVGCDRCSAPPAVVFRSTGGHVRAFCQRCRPKVENYRLATLQGLVDGWRGRGGETRDRSVAAAQRRLDAVLQGGR
jgi:hypothetical protein